MALDHLFDETVIVRTGLVRHDPATCNDLELTSLHDQPLELGTHVLVSLVPPKGQIARLGPNELSCLFLRERFDYRVEYVLGLDAKVLLKSHDPSRVVVRVRDHEDFELLFRRPLTLVIGDIESLLPHAAVYIVKCQLLVEVSRL